jgi:uncharacterized membrane protein YgdD (TMEM256/DUF423 family)
MAISKNIMSTMSNQILLNRFVGFGAASMFIAVAAGAFGAHGLKHLLSADMLAVYHTAVDYQMYHSLGLILVGLLLSSNDSTGIRRSGWLMLAGIIIFSGSLYLLSLTDILWLGAITPIGGLCFLAAWFNLAWQVFKTRA